MDFTAILNLIWNYIDPLVVALVIVGMEVFKRLLPTPEGAASKAEVMPLMTRFLPLFPLLLGVLIFYLKNHFGCPASLFFSVVLMKGLLSGAMGSYVYRTYKVTILGS